MRLHFPFAQLLVAAGLLTVAMFTHRLAGAFRRIDRHQRFKEPVAKIV